MYFLSDLYTLGIYSYQTTTLRNIIQLFPIDRLNIHQWMINWFLKIIPMILAEEEHSPNSKQTLLFANVKWNENLLDSTFYQECLSKQDWKPSKDRWRVIFVWCWCHPITISFNLTENHIISCSNCLHQFPSIFFELSNLFIYLNALFILI